MTFADQIAFASRGDHSRGKTDKNIGRVDIDTQRAVYLPNGLGNLFRNLQEFFVWFSQLKIVQRENFRNMEGLVRLDLAYNQIDYIPENTFWDLPELEGLWIQENKIKLLPKDLFKSLNKLKVFAAEKNQISQLERELFRNTPSIEKIYLGENKLKSISVEFESLQGISALDFTLNICIDKEYNAESNWCSDSHCVSKGELLHGIRDNCKE